MERDFSLHPAPSLGLLPLIPAQHQVTRSHEQLGAEEAQERDQSFHCLWVLTSFQTRVQSWLGRTKAEQILPMGVSGAATETAIGTQGWQR